MLSEIFRDNVRRSLFNTEAYQVNSQTILSITLLRSTKRQKTDAPSPGLRSKVTLDHVLRDIGSCFGQRATLVDADARAETRLNEWGPGSLFATATARCRARTRGQ